MRSLIRLTDYSIDDIFEIFKIADEVKKGKYKNFLSGKTAVMFLPNSSIRTRVSFDKGIYLLGGQSILFPPETLDKKEEIKDVCGYLNNWADIVIVRYSDIAMLEKLSKYLDVPVINAMTDINHPCEILSDLYALSKMRKDFTKDKYLFCGMKGNIGLAWKEAACVFGLDFNQCCEPGYEIEGFTCYHDIRTAILGKDIICTDSIPEEELLNHKNCQVTKEVLGKANEGALLNPCPPFYRGEEVSKDVMESDYFVGYEFKKNLLYVEQAIMIYCMTIKSQEYKK